MTILSLNGNKSTLNLKIKYNKQTKKKQFNNSNAFYSIFRSLDNVLFTSYFESFVYRRYSDSSNQFDVRQFFS